MLLAHNVHSLIKQYHTESQDDEPPELSIRERECLKLVLEGHTISEIAEAIYRSESTVRFHLRNASRKLKARNSVHAAFLAYQTSGQLN